MIRVFLLVSLGLLWAARLSAIKAAGLSGIPVHVVVSVSTFGIAIMFSLVATFRSAWPPLSRATLFFYVLSGLLGFILPFSVESLVAPHLPVFILVVIIATMPIMTLGLSALIGHQRLNVGTITAVILGFLGVLFLIWDTARFGEAGQADLVWVAVAFGVPVLYAANTVFIATRWPAAADAIQVAHAQALILSVAALIGGLTFGGLRVWSEATLNVPAIALIILCEGGALMLYLKLARTYGAIFVSFANYISMLFAALIGAHVFGDRITWYSALAAVAIIASVVIYQRGTRRQEQPS
ncbi:DMT family transporter [Cognatiyoonia sp. IB215182]|uniref:DMT family transporter n=1 Tax=Cognatiyoonia sp. IB215182 TaxID=3097353 RepID=UPI002A0BB234|nr:DMT family transporter [Cognatiyoonia sp. IB215182]MDX8351037.1 DMT family transporter [Cognatiyoonia sp. IB215182]